MSTNTVDPAQPTASTVVVATDGSVTVTQVSNATTVTYPGVFVPSGTVPAQVGTVTPSAGNEQVGLSWSAPNDGGSAITDYSVQYSTDDATWSTFAHGTTATTATVTGLTNGTLYYFRVAAINALGTGAYSASVTATPEVWSPLTLSPLTWYDASDTGTITELSGSVSQWDDKSGNGYDLTQATSNAQPKTGTATINSLNVLEYDLTNNNQRIVNSSVPLTGTSYTMFAVYDINSNDTLYALLSTSNASGYAYLGWSGNTGSLHSQMSGLSLHINGVEFTGTNRDDVYTAVGNAPVVLRVQFTSSTYNGLSFGYNLSSAVTFGFGTKVAEAFVAASPTAQEITDAEQYLADKWGITLP